MDDFKLTEDTMRDLRRIAQSPGEFEWRMELLAKIERGNMRHELFVRAAVKELKRLDKEKLGLTEVSKRINIELDERMKVPKNLWNSLKKGGLWVLERSALVGFTYLAVKLGIQH